jgi:hypothetical protein
MSVKVPTLRTWNRAGNRTANVYYATFREDVGYSVSHLRRKNLRTSLLRLLRECLIFCEKKISYDKMQTVNISDFRVPRNNILVWDTFLHALLAIIIVCISPPTPLDSPRTRKKFHANSPQTPSVNNLFTPALECHINSDIPIRWYRKDFVSFSWRNRMWFTLKGSAEGRTFLFHWQDGNLAVLYLEVTLTSTLAGSVHFQA